MDAARGLWDHAPSGADASTVRPPPVPYAKRKRRNPTSPSMRVAALCLLVLGLAGCNDSVPIATAPSPPPPLPVTAVPPATPTPVFPPRFVLTAVVLSGVVTEVTPRGTVPIADVYVYCEPCGQETHTFALTDANGVYRFPGDPAMGGGVWLAPGTVTQIRVTKDGYQDPPGLPALTGPIREPGWRDVWIDGDTRFDVQLVRR